MSAPEDGREFAFFLKNHAALRVVLDGEIYKAPLSPLQKKTKPRDFSRVCFW